MGVMQKEAAKRFAEAVRLQQDGLLRDAVEAYQDALAYDPRLELARSNLAMLRYQLGEVDQAIQQYRLLLETHPYNVKAHYNLGVILASVGRYDEAAASYRQVIALDDRHAMALGNLAWIYGQLRRYPEAIATYEKLLAINPEDPEVLFQLGSCALRAGRMAEAERAWRRALAGDPRHLQSLLCMVEVARGRSDWHEALRWALDALSVAPNNQTAVSTAARAHMELLEFAEAATLLLKLAEHQPENAEIRFQLGVLYHTAGNLEEARYHLMEAARLADHRFDILNEYASVLYAMDDLEGATRAFEAALRLQPDHAIVQANLGFCYMRLGRAHEARACFEGYMKRPEGGEAVRHAVQGALDLL